MPTIVIRITLIIVLILFSGYALCQYDPDRIITDCMQKIETGEPMSFIVAKAAHVVPSDRQMEYLKREFIAFLHFGPNTFTGREWGTGTEDSSVFAPDSINTDQWCRILKSAGMKTAVLTCKHHDGYCLWQTRYEIHHSVNTSPWKNGKGDVVKELALSCEKYGMGLGIYLSPADLFQIESPTGLYGNGSKPRESVIPTDPVTFLSDPKKLRPDILHDAPVFTFKVDDYNRYFLNQLYELLTEYGPVSEVWLDGATPKEKGGQKYNYSSWYELIRKLAPDAIIFGKGPDVRWCGNEDGRTRESEWNVIPLPVDPGSYDWPDRTDDDLGSRQKIAGARYLYYQPAEINTSIRKGWFWRNDDEQLVRSTDDVFDIYERTVGGNGVFMLNVPPNRHGMISGRDSACLSEVGQRIQSTYGTDLASSSTSSATGIHDTDVTTYWQPPDSTGEFSIALQQKVKVNRFILQEATTTFGQRIEKHALDAWIEGKWKEVAIGTTVGYKKILRFDPVITDKFRVRIIESRLQPSIAEISAHYYAQPMLQEEIQQPDEDGGFIKNPERIADIKRMLKVQEHLTSNSPLSPWDVFDQSMPTVERQAMEFLYAYMPLSDLADYQPSFFLDNVRQSIKARKEMPWGKSVPEEEFLHYVLPLRVNNENLDSFRLVMFDELKERVRGLCMKEAALEINHWCHEKVDYRGTDARTSSPLNTIKKSFGRCGEESTFTVAAMRTAGIPSRQVYTPRWAHTDDNHAWVEVWVEGEWYYMGACEPEPDLNMGWFSEPSGRAMLVHTRAYGRYFGEGDMVTENNRFSELNLTSSYAPVKQIVIIVKNTDGRPVDSARVEFQLYNSAEYYALATKYTNPEGIAKITTGLGDMLVWSAKDEYFGYSRLSVPETDTLQLVLNAGAMDEKVEFYDMVPPHSITVKSNVSEQARKENNRRLAFEDSIRNAYMSTFKDTAWAKSLAMRLQLSPDSVIPCIIKSHGNWREISSYIEKNLSISLPYMLALIYQLSDKDYSDARESILTDHLVQATKPESRMKGTGEDLFIKYVLSPRIQLENLSPWRSALRKEFGSEMTLACRNDISVLTKWIRQNIRIDKQANMLSRAPLTPTGVYNLRAADPLSRDIFFVAACRTFGIPSRLNPETQMPEYWANEKWNRAGLDPEVNIRAEKGYLHLTSGKDPIIPQYYNHFTLGFYKDGFYRTLEFPAGRNITEFPDSIVLDTGRYMLVTGNRLEDGSVLSSLWFFKIRKGDITKTIVDLRKQPEILKSSGQIKPGELWLIPEGKNAAVSLSSLMQGQNSVLIILDPDKEPSWHILNDMGPYIEHFDRWRGRFIFAVAPEKTGRMGVLKKYQLPAGTVSGVDYNNNIINALDKIYGPEMRDKLPLVIYCDKDGVVFHFSSGYVIGTGEKILKVISNSEVK